MFGVNYWYKFTYLANLSRFWDFLYSIIYWNPLIFTILWSMDFSLIITQIGFLFFLCGLSELFLPIIFLLVFRENGYLFRSFTRLPNNLVYTFLILFYIVLLDYSISPIVSLLRCIMSLKFKELIASYNSLT